ncbi:MAG: four helix bundle protein [Bacteroidota bacterium]
MSDYEQQAEALRQRTKAFAVRVVRLFRTLPKTDGARVMGRQLLRSATSVAANYRAVCRARSRAAFVAKLDIVVEEADESVLWLELLGETETVSASRLNDLLNEATELTKIFAAARRTSRSR